MKVWEALQVLEAMDGNKEVTLTFGVRREEKPLPQMPKQTDYFVKPHSVQWVIDKEFWPQRNEITCKPH